jgi:hypothetical protein
MFTGPTDNQPLQEEWVVKKSRWGFGWFIRKTNKAAQHLGYLSPTLEVVDNLTKECYHPTEQAANEFLKRHELWNNVRTQIKPS